MRGFLNYERYLAGKKFMVLENTINLEENISSVTIREVHKDTANIT